MSESDLIETLFKGILHRMPRQNEHEHWTRKLGEGMSAERLASSLIESREFAKVSQRMSSLFVPPGHFYSPIVDVDALRGSFDPPRAPTTLPGVSISVDKHLSVWEELLPFLRDIPFCAEASPEFRYHFTNPAYSWGDGSILHAMLRRFRPRRMVEVGSGFSSACSIDTIERYLGGDVDVTFVEPYPELLKRLLGEQSSVRCSILPQPVQAVDPALFASLREGDFLFIDSTHVMKTGSDVCHELFEILPRLNPGVFVHFHDIFWPFEYGKKWVLEENRSWNEIYGLRAFLTYNDAFEIVFFNDYFVRHCRPRVAQDYPAMLNNTGGAIWLRKLA